MYVNLSWKVEKKLASGGMGEVFLARTPEGQRVAVKLTSSEQEVRLLVRLRHPSIISILGCSSKSLDILGEERGPCYWMEYVEGENILTAARKADRKTVLGWLVQALEALQYLHDEGILHGDLSPANVLIDSKGRLKLIDFGASDGGPTGGSATLPYMAPERMDGQSTPAGDLFSLGTIFYEALAGRHPRAGRKNIHDFFEKEAKPLDDSLEGRVIGRMIRAHPEERMSRAENVLEALRGGEMAPAQPITEYHASKMIGAEGYFSAIHRWLESPQKGTTLVGVHGVTGTGKSRFVREAAYLCSQAGVPYRIHLSLEIRPPAELASLLKYREADSEGPAILVFLEWNEDGLKPEADRFLKSVLEWPRVMDVPLANLNRPRTETFLKGALGAETAGEASADLFRLTGGNPLLLTELVRCLLEKRAQTGKSFSKKWIEDLKELRTIDKILLHRIAGLDKEEMQVLQALAAAHEPTTLPGIVSVTGLATASEIMARLIGKELAVRGKGTYQISLSALENAALDPLEAKNRDALHRRWLKFLKDAPGDDLQKIHHAIEARDKALVLAGARPSAERLLKEARFEEALALVNRALPLASIQDVDEISRLLRLKINLLNEMGRFEAALEVCDEWFELSSRDEPQPLRSVKYWFMTGLNHQNLGNHGEAEARLRRCLEEGEPNDDTHRPFLVRAYSRLGAHELAQGRVSEAKNLFKRGLDLAGPVGRRRAEICRNLAEALAHEKDTQGAKRLFAEAVELYRNENYSEGEFSTSLQEGNLALLREDFIEAEDCYRKALSIAEASSGDILQRALAESNLGILARRRDDWAESLRLLIKSQDYFLLLGNRRDLAQNTKNLAVTEAALGRFVVAEARIKELRELAPGLSDSEVMISEAEKALREARDQPTGLPDSKRLMAIYQKLPPEHQVTFAERGDFKALGFSGDISQESKGTEDIMGILDDLTELNRELLEETDMKHLLKRLMDRALEIAGAENGFLLLKSEDQGGPLPGYRVAVARNMSAKSVERGDDLPSLSAVKRAMQTGLPVVADNALEDPLFHAAKSVHLHKLKSLIALPVIGTEGVLGVFYMDHRLTKGLFSGETLAALRAFAGIAALALQKERMIDSLRAANANLSEEVEIKTSEMGLMQRELKKSRMVLKNEYSEIVGRSPKMMEVLTLVDRITDARIPVWIYGESGTGKESIARALHFNSSRAARPIVTENCSALPEALLESELFGHKKGAFTHAVTDKKGILEYANGGTIFLDEIADMSLNLQAKLLRFLQEGEIRPVGSSQMIKVDVRVVSASNKHLEELVRQKKFREDLYFRLNGVTVTLPPLRDRREDIPLLTDHFLERISHREKKAKCKISQEAMRLLMKYDWPGNIRELQNSLETAVLFTEKGAIVPSSFQFKPGLSSSKPSLEPITANEMPKEKIPPDLEKILRALRDTGFHRSKAAEALGMSRRNFYTKLEKLGVPRDHETLRAYVEKYV